MSQSGHFEITATSDLSAPAAEVFARVVTMDGVNDELMPIMRMTVPSNAPASLLDDRVAELVGTGQPVFRSWILGGGIVPIDRHSLALDRVFTGPAQFGFDEMSTSWAHRSWQHHRRIEPTTDGCRVTDHIVAVARVGIAAPVLRRIASRLFEHRHRHLRRWVSATYPCRPEPE